MRATSSSYLVHKTHLRQKALTLRIPQHVHDALNAARDRADSAGFVFDVQAVVVQALERAVSHVGDELEAVALGEQGSAKTQTRTAGAAPKRVRVKSVSVPDSGK